jgi:hypothetical protein
MPLFRAQVTYEFCIDAPDTDAAQRVFSREHTIAIEDGRCSAVGEVLLSGVNKSTDFEEATLDEVPLNALDHTLRERLIEEDVDH